MKIGNDTLNPSFPTCVIGNPVQDPDDKRKTLDPRLKMSGMTEWAPFSSLGVQAASLHERFLRNMSPKVLIGEWKSRNLPFRAKRGICLFKNQGQDSSHLLSRHHTCSEAGPCLMAPSNCMRCGPAPRESTNKPNLHRLFPLNKKTNLTY